VSAVGVLAAIVTEDVVVVLVASIEFEVSVLLDYDRGEATFDRFALPAVALSAHAADDARGP
jgi:hypothetical protein